VARGGNAGRDQRSGGNAAGGAANFTIDRTTLMDSVLPPGGQQFMEEISKGLGIDLLDPKGWSKEQVVNAKKLAAELDEKMMMMQELMPAVMKFLEFQVSVAEFHACSSRVGENHGRRPPWGAAVGGVGAGRTGEAVMGKIPPESCSGAAFVRLGRKAAETVKTCRETAIRAKRWRVPGAARQDYACNPPTCPSLALF